MKNTFTIILIGLTLFICGIPLNQCVGFQEASPIAVDQEPIDNRVKFVESDDLVQVFLGDELFTTFDFGNFEKPIFYPIHGPGQIGMTRNWPMKDGIAGEAKDHPHHKSMWISHEISGIDFWAEKGGSVRVQSIEILAENDDAFRTNSLWIDEDKKTILSDSTLYRFGGDTKSRWIDCTITFQATNGDFEFEDTKEGLFAIRTHPDLRLDADPKRGVAKVFGKAINSEGIEGKAIWGKKAKWLYYHGTIEGTPMGIAMFDHPDNLRHPTTWHARAYGLVTANPFGAHHFLGKEKGTGSFIVKNGSSLTLRYRVVFLNGEPSADQIRTRYESFCER